MSVAYAVSDDTEEVMRDAETGLVYVNAGTTGAEIQLPFGGMKATGNGHREAGRAALDVYSEWKSIYIDYGNTLYPGDRTKASVDADATERGTSIGYSTHKQ